MKKFALGGVAALAVAAFPALAQQPQRSAPQPLTRASVQQMVAANFAKADADKDGFVTKAEVDTHKSQARAERKAKRAERRDERFARLDADKDGQISRSEFDARVGRAERAERRAERAGRFHGRGMMNIGARFGARFIERADADRDGRVSIAEASTGPLARFDRADANKDGTLTQEERRAAFEAFREKRKAKRG